MEDGDKIMNSHIDPKMLLGLSATAITEKSVARDNPEALRKTCQEFEAIFVQAMLKNMRATVPDGGLLDKGLDADIFQEMMDQEIAKQIAQRQSFGIAEALYQQLREGE